MDSRSGTAPLDLLEQAKVKDTLLNERNLYIDLTATLPVGVYRLRVKAAREWVNDEWVTRLGTNYSIEMANDEFCRILGITQAQRKANTTIVVERIHPEDRPDFIAKNVEALNSPATFHWAGRIVRGSEERWVNFVSVPRTLSNGDMLWTGVLQDTTESRMAAESLRESEARYRSLFEQAGDSIVVFDQKTTAFLDFNDNACHRLGYTREEFSKLKLTDLEIGETPPQVRRHIRRIVAEGDPIFETRHRAKNGEVLDVEIRPKAMVIAGKIVIQAIWHDITTRKIIERQLQSSEANLAALFNGSIEPIMLLDPKGIVLSVNAAMCNRLSIAAKDFIGQSAFLVLPRELAMARQLKFAETVKTGCSRRFEDRWNERVMEIQMSPILGPSGKVIRVAVFTHDITDRVRAESLLRNVNEKLEMAVNERTEQLRALAVELTQAEHRERRRIAHVLHEDLQQRLVGIQYTLHSLKEFGSPRAGDQMLDKTIKELSGTIHLARELATQISPPVLAALGFRATLDWLAKEVQGKCGLAVRVTGCRSFKLASEGIQNFAFDAIRELLLNTCKHAAVRSARIHLWFAGKSQLAIEVSDQGKGGARIPNKPQNFGLLSIRERAFALGVGFDLVSHPGQGTCVTLILPMLGKGSAKDTAD